MKSFEESCLKLKNRLSKSLPGSEAHSLMLPKNRILRFNLKLLPFAKKSGVNIILYPDKDQIFSILIERNSYKGIHSDQIGLPGGKKEKSDKNIEETALRETHEEIGLNSSNLQIIGSLSRLYIPPSNFMVYPIVTSINHKPLLIPDKNEIKSIITYPIKMLLDNANVKIKTFKGNHYSIEAPYFDILGYSVWGATAMILSEFKKVLYEC